MRPSIGIGVLLVALGALFSFIASSLLGTAGAGFNSFASSFGAILFLFAASVLLGIGAGLVISWFADFARTLVSFTIKICFGLAFFFVGLGIAVASRNWLLAIHIIFACTIGGITLVILAFATLVSGAVKGTAAVAKNVERKIRKKAK